MPAISIPWSVVLLMAPILMPYVSVPSALVGGYAWYRRNRSFYGALLAAVVGGFAVPWAVLAIIVLAQGVSGTMTPLSRGLLALLGLFGIGGLVSWGVSHAGSRRRGGN